MVEVVFRVSPQSLTNDPNRPMPSTNSPRPPTLGERLFSAKELPDYPWRPSGAGL